MDEFVKNFWTMFSSYNIDNVCLYKLFKIEGGVEFVTSTSTFSYSIEDIFTPNLSAKDLSLFANHVETRSTVHGFNW